MSDLSSYGDRLTAALRRSGVFAGPDTVETIEAVVRDLVRDELATLGGHLLQESILTSAAYPELEHLAGSLVSRYGKGVD
jgi:hypothetical protein